MNFGSFFKGLLESGTTHVGLLSERRNVWITNFISLVFSAFILVVFLYRILNGAPFSVFWILLVYAIISFAPILLNKAHFNNASRILISWFPPSMILLNAGILISNSFEVETSTFLGVRIFLIPFATIPFLVFNSSEKGYLIVGLIVPILCLFMFDPILNYFGVGYFQVGLHESSYSYNNFRTFISYFILSTSFYFLKRAIEKGERINEHLLVELEEKSKLVLNKAEDQIAANEKKYRSLFDQASDSILITDFRGQLIDVNSMLCKTLGYEKEELLQLHISDLIDAADLKANPIRFDLLMGGEHILNQRRMVTKSGSIVEVEANVKKFGNEGIMAIVRDVTELRKVERQIQLSETMFRTAFDHSAIGMALTSPEGKIIRVNSQLSKITGYSEAELLSQTLREITHPDEIETDEILITRCIRGEIEMYEREKRYINKSGSVSWVKVAASLVRQVDGTPLYFVRQIEDISEQKKAEQEKEQTRYLLNERMKELTTLYRTSQILQDEEGTVDELMHQIVMILPPGWQYPEITAARIVIGGIEFKTPNFSHGLYKQSAEFMLPQGMKGVIEVTYLEARPLQVEGPFFAEERDLINMLAEMLRTYFARRYEANALKSSEANLNATINNTKLLIWSVDRNLNLITFNKSFFNHIKKHYAVEVEVGSKVLDKSASSEGGKLSHKWNNLYGRVLDGESITLEEKRFDIDFSYSLSPIIEKDGRISGVNIFAADITDQKARAAELADANKKIGELRLMALRSVMNPHFIFNVLNSIQFFIAGNDRLNAINYLSKFSKLMRSILTNSISNKIKLNEEIEILKNYIQLEMVRFQDKFNYVFEIDPGLEMDSIEIPSLLVQPYVENAILHGLYNKQEKGTLTIRIREEDDAVIFEIEDDGVGREAAMKIKEQSFSDHKSLGVKLTEERLKLINEHHNVSFKIIDLKNEKGQPSGTRVIIWVRI